QRIVIPFSPISRCDPLRGWVYFLDAAFEMHLVRRQSRSACAPDCAGSAAFGEMKNVVRAPRHIVFLENQIMEDPAQICDCDTFAHPAMVHLVGRISPDFEVI